MSPSGKEPPLIAGGEAQEGMTWVGHAGPWRSIHCHMVPASGSILVCDDPTGRARRAVFCLAQDAHGALWLGTEEGPIRFDGLGWGPPAGLAPLSHSLAWTIDCTEPGSLWVGTKDAGLWRLEERTAAFVPRATLTGPDGLADSDIISLGRDDAGALWVGTHDGLAVVEGDRVRACFTARDGIPQAGICALAQDPGGYMLAGSLGGLLVFDSGGPCARLSAGDGLPDPCVYTLRADGHGGIWAGTRQGIAVLRAGRVREVIQEGLPAEVRTLCRDRAGRMWAGTAKGLALIERGAVQRVWTRADGLPSSAVWALLCDRAGRIWVGTEAGLAVLPGAARPAQAISLPGARDPSLVAFGADGRRVVIGDAQGLLAAEDAATPIVEPLPTPAALARAGVWAVAAVDGHLWAGGRYGGLFCLARDDGAVAMHVDGVGAVSCLCPDGQDRLWVGTLGSGLACVGCRDGSILLRLTVAEGLPSDHVPALVIDHLGQLWAATLGGGLALLDRERGLVERVIGPEQGLPSAVVSHVALDGEGRLWAATRGGGLCVLDPAARRVLRTWTREDGLPSDALYSCCCDGRGAVWAGTARGLVRILPRTGRCLTLGRPHGLPSDDCWQSSLLHDGDGGIWVGTTEGIARVSPRAVPTDVEPCRVHLTEVRVMGRQRLDAEDMEIEDSEYDLEFEFGAIEYDAPAQVTYRTRLVGLDDE